ncbi:hypothetical protein BDN70DRAFT_845074 [Pholiota conissans]|uniref:ASX DEUBAD domain-containing protein n=1 Tax=Pholiota conissans TaxID=109636 RepID=A0A9P5YL36_9AGAR|nr:hypothetical protein BDN70DRAFT_845074 [Pholiota conissans]
MDRPRRTLRPSAKVSQSLDLETKATTRIVKPKPAPEPIDPQKQLKALLESSKSDLVSLEMHDIINVDTWSALPEDACRRLKELLPPTAFIGARETIGTDHPSVVEDCTSMEVDAPNVDGTIVEDKILNPGFFNDLHFLAAARTFQDHLYLGWFSEAHRAKVKQFEEGIVAGTMAAPWKDEVWIRDNSIPLPPTASSSFTFPSESSARAGGASEIKLSVLVKNGIIRVGDVIAYKRFFTLCDLTVEKDCVIDAIQPKTNALTVLTASGPTKDLPAHLLSSSPTSDPSPSPDSSSPPTSLQSMTITSPTMLETGLLDLDGRVDKTKRPNGNAWKSFTIWRWRQGAEYNPYDARGGRENHGTLFYLRGSYYHEI